MFDIKIVCNNKEFHWYENVESFTINEDILAMKWWSIASQKNIYTVFKQSEIKKIKIKNKG